MSLPRPHVIALADNPSVRHNNGTYHRIGRGTHAPAAGQMEAAAHPFFVFCRPGGIFRSATLSFF